MINLHIVEGRLTKNPDYRVDDKNKQVYANATLACTRNYKSREGTYESDFITIALKGKGATHFAKHCMKGDLVSITGRTQTDVVTNPNGQKQYYTKTHVMSWNLLAKAKAQTLPIQETKRPSSAFPNYHPNQSFNADIESMNLPSEEGDMI